jgi:5-methylcytosine-specific restriction enzyme subunit McrC
VQAVAHVGRIQLGDILITVEPKIGTSELLELLRYAYGLRNLRLFEETGFAHTGELLQDLLAAQLLAEVTELAARGLAKKYVPRSEELASPRGRIDFGAVARRGPAASATLPCRHHRRSSDHHLNRITRAGVDLAADIAQEAGLRRSLRRLSARLGAEIDEVPLSVDSLVTVTALFTRRVFTLFERNGAVVDAWWGAGRYDSGFRFRARARSGGTGIGNGSYRATAR